MGAYATGTEGTGTGGTDTPVTTPVAVTGVSLNKSTETLVKGATVTLTATVAPDTATDKTVTWSSDATNVATVSNDGTVTAVGGGTATITATAGNVSDSCTVTVTGDTIKSVAPVAIEVAFNTTAEGVAAKLAATEVNVTYTNNNTGKEKIFVWAAEGEYKANVPGNYTFKCAAYNATATVTVNKATLKSTTLGTVAVPVGTDKDDLEDWLYDEDFDGVELEFNESFTDDFTIGNDEDDDAFEWWTCSNYDEDEAGTYTFTAKARAHDLYDLKDLTLKVLVYSEDYEVEFDREGGSLSSVANYIDSVLEALYGSGLDVIEIVDYDLEGGTLYTDSDCDSELEEEELDADDFAALYYLPNGSGETSTLEYVAYHDYEDDDDECIEGEIYLVADSYMMLSYQITEDDIIEFSGDEFEELFLEQDKDYEELSYVTFSLGSGSKSKGWLYYEYDEDEEEGKQVKSTKCYVNSDDEDDVALDDVVFVPGSSMKAGTYTITYTAKGYEDGSTKLKTETGYIVITFVEKADITIEAGKNEEVEIDADLFQEYLEETDTSKKDVEIVSVTITGAPRSKTAGYLVTDGDEITKSGSKTFYTDPSKNQYDLSDLNYVGGNKASETRADFEICYTREGSSTKRYVTGTIDFIVGSTHTLNGTIKAAETMKFSASISAFEDLGDNDNEYIEFTSLPKFGKLYYNYGTASQEDVKTGVKYYTSYKSGQKMLSYVTYVPSYQSSKVAKTDSIPVKAYNSKDKAVAGTINIGITYASASAYFTDISNSTYADSVDFLKNENITTGMTATTFGPNSNVTRGQFVTFLYRAAGEPAVTGTNTFKDVKTSDYYYKAVLWAVKSGITNGRSATVFAPNDNVTHQELLTFLYRYDVTYLKHAGTLGSASSIYDYSKVDTWAQTAARWAVNKQIISAGNLQPTVAGTRATVALWLHRMLTL